MDIIGQWSQILLIFFLSVIKYGFGLFTAVNSNVGLWQSILTNLVGGAVGVFLFTYFGAAIKTWWLRKKYGDSKPKKFTKWNRFQIFLKDRFGLVGIAIFSPIILTIPIGVILALQITNNKKKIFFFIYGGCILWSFAIFLIDYFFKFNLMDWIFPN